MSFDPLKVYSVGLASAATSTSAFTFPHGTVKAYLEIPTMTSAADFRLLGSTDGTNYRNVMQEVPQTASIQVQTFTIASGAANRIVPIPLAAPYMKIEVTTAPVSAATFKVICN